MNRTALFQTLARAGIDPAKTFPHLRLTESPRLRAPTNDEFAVIHSYVTSPVARQMLSPITRADDLLVPVGTGVQGYRGTGPDSGPSALHPFIPVSLSGESAFAPVFAGWNVWAVWQVSDLPITLLSLGVSRDRQLQVWVEDHVRLEAPEAKVADPLDLKGSQVQIVNGEPPGLKEFIRKEQVPGDPMLLETQDEPPELRFVRFFNRGAASSLPWPHDELYLLDRVYQPDPGNVATQGPGPGTITDRNVLDPAKEAAKGTLEMVVVVGVVALLGYAALTQLPGLGSRASAGNQ